MKGLKIFRDILIIVLILIACFFLYRLFSNNFDLGLGNPESEGSQPTPNLTAIAEWTPTPNSPDQAAALVATAWPTPVTRIMPADREAFRAAFLTKLTAQSINWSLLSNLNHAGVAWRCSDIKLGNLSLPASTSGTMVALWASWYGGVDNSTMTVTIEDGSLTSGVLNEQENTIDIYQNAIVSISFPNFGIVGPEIQQGNEIALMVDKPSILYGVWLTPREWITGEDLIGEKQNDNTNAALNWAKVDSVAPLNHDGSRDQTYLDLLYYLAAGNLDPNAASLKLPNGNIVPLDHTLYQTLMSVAQEVAKEAGYASVESLTITIQKPSGIDDYVYLSNSNVPVVPVDIAAQMIDSTCPQVQLDEDTFVGLQAVNLPDDVTEGIFKRLLEVTKE